MSAAKPRRGGLGRGLETLIPVSPARNDDSPAPTDDDRTHRIVPIDTIVANPWQPRTAMDTQRLEELAASIRTHGLMQPLIVTESSTPDRYELIAGERRWRASRMAGLASIPVIVREATPQAKLELALVENVIRADLRPLEEAHAYRQLIDDFGLTQAQVGERVGKSRVAITNTLRLLSSPEQIQTAVNQELIAEGHARALLGLPNLTDQVAALDIVLEKGLNVRQTEDLVRNWGNRQRESLPPPAPPPADVHHFEERLRSALGTKVSLRQSAQGGSTLTIQFFSDEQLQAFYNLVAGDDLW